MRRTSVVLLSVAVFFSSCSYFNSTRLINGSRAPEISLPDREGKTVSLSSLRGNLVLVEFWASWCMPCREQNPQLVELYDKYQGKAFEKAEGLKMMSISLDMEKGKWVEAIQKDSLHWEYHLNDFLGWKSVAVDSYHVSSIPSSFLVDQNGIIIGKDLKPRELKKLLAALSK